MPDPSGRGDMEQFTLVMAEWDAQSEADRQFMLDQWDVLLNMEELKEAGILAGGVDVNLNLVRMLYGYAIGTGMQPQTENQDVLNAHVQLLAAGGPPPTVGVSAARRVTKQPRKRKPRR
jgi:hypothetical protein